jgi:NADPH:quinone reductase-like Zn-dependent oxidoreductase
MSTPDPEPARSQTTMTAVVTRGQGGFEMLDVCEVPIPEPASSEVRLRVLAAGINNTEINTRLGWYSSSVTGATDDVVGSVGAGGQRIDGGWNATTPFPLIQGTDCCGAVDAVGDGVDPSLVGARVLVRPCMRPNGFDSMENVWMGSDFDGAFAEFVTVPVTEVFPVSCDWTDAELGSIPCAYGTAENMLHRAGVEAGEDVLVTGASGGVGSAVVQLARRRGARVTAVASAAKIQQVAALGADVVIERDAQPPQNSFDVVVDNVVGATFGQVMSGLRRGGRYVTSGAIGGPTVELDMRTLYLRDLRMIGCTAWDAPVFSDLIGYIERGEIRPIVAKTFPMVEIVAAQQEFLRRSHVGKFVLIP